MPGLVFCLRGSCCDEEEEEESLDLEGFLDGGDESLLLRPRN